MDFCRSADTRSGNAGGTAHCDGWLGRSSVGCFHCPLDPKPSARLAPDCGRAPSAAAAILLPLSPNYCLRLSRAPSLAEHLNQWDLPGGCPPLLLAEWFCYPTSRTSHQALRIGSRSGHQMHARELGHKSNALFSPSCPSCWNAARSNVAANSSRVWSGLGVWQDELV